MPYYEDLDLFIKEEYNVNPPFSVSVRLCKVAKRYCQSKKNILDMGTGTGIVGIYLSRIGNDVTSTDINLNALKLAEHNSKNNNTNLTILYSDIYSNISSKFDIIIFSIPFVPYEHNYSRFFSYMYKKCLPEFIRRNINKLIFRLKPLKIYAWNTRKEIVFRFLKESKNYLTNDGIIIATVLETDLHLFRNEKIGIMEEIRSKDFPDEYILIYKYISENT